MSIEPITIPMSIESNDVTIESTFDARIEVVEGGSITVESLSVNTNGTTTAPTGKAYSPVVVNVPNSYTNSDEGKVVKNGALTSQTSTTKSANGTYDTTTNNQVTVAVPASAVDAGTKNITSNGNNQDVVGYAAVNVSVPNSYSAADEGKVVSSGALVSQTSDTVTTNDTYDTTLINSLTVNVSGGGGTKNAIIAEVTPASNAFNISFACDFLPDYVFIINYTPYDNYEANGNTFKYPSNANIAYVGLYPEWWNRVHCTTGNSSSVGFSLKDKASEPTITLNNGVITISSNGTNMNYAYYKSGNRYVIIAAKVGDE